LQDAYDLLTGKITTEKIQLLVETEGAKKAQRLKNPIFYKNNFPANLVPDPVMKGIESVYFNARDYTQNKTKTKKTSGVTGTTIEMLKEVAPERINNIVELFLALILFFFIFALSKISKIKGQIVVDKPKFNIEDTNE
jgi:hypothetical protein